MGKTFSCLQWWNTILTTLFPSAQGYVVIPHRPLPDDFYLIIEVMKISTTPFTRQCVLIVEIKNSQHWEYGLPELQRQTTR